MLVFFPHKTYSSISCLKAPIRKVCKIKDLNNCNTFDRSVSVVQKVHFPPWCKDTHTHPHRHTHTPNHDLSCALNVTLIHTHPSRSSVPIIFIGICKCQKRRWRMRRTRGRKREAASTPRSLAVFARAWFTLKCRRRLRHDGSVSQTSRFRRCGEKKPQNNSVSS